MDYDVLNKAGLSIGEFAAMIVIKDEDGSSKSVSRTAVYNWIRGKSAPSEKPAKRIRALLQIIESAVNDGDLPVNIALSRTERRGKVLSALVKHKTKVANESA